MNLDLNSACTTIQVDKKLLEVLQRNRPQRNNNGLGHVQVEAREVREEPEKAEDTRKLNLHVGHNSCSVIKIGSGNRRGGKNNPIQTSDERRQRQTK